MGASFPERLDHVTSEMRRIMVNKRAMYGVDNVIRQGLNGIMLRISEDKMSRVTKEISNIALHQQMLEHGVPLDLVKKYVPVGAQTTDSLEDNLLDIANYCIIAVMLLHKTWVTEDDDEETRVTTLPEHQVRAVIP